MKKTAKLVVASWMTAALVVGCEADEEIDAAEAVAAVELAETQSGLMPGGLLPFALGQIEQGMTTQEAAEQAALTAEATFEPEGCVSADHSDNVAVYTLDGCIVRHGMGRILHPTFGRRHRHGMSGTFTLTFEATRTGLTIGIVGSDITGRKAGFDVVGQAELTFQESLRSLSVTTEGTGTTRCGDTMTRQASHTRTYDPETNCLTLDGSWTFSGPKGAMERTVTGYRRCGDSCPEAGGQVTGPAKRHGKRHGGGGPGEGHKGDRGSCGEGHGDKKDTQAEVIVTTTFDGTALANWESSESDSGTIPLVCEPLTD